MADRTVRVRLSANVNEYTRSVDRAANSTDKLRAKAEAFDGRDYGADFDAKTQGAESNIERLKRAAEKYDKSSYSARFTANTNEIRKAQEDMDRQLAGLGRQQKRGLLTEQIATTKRELAELQRFAAKHTPELDLKIDKLYRAKEVARRELDALKKGKVDPEVELRIKKAEAQRNKIKQKLTELSNAKATPEVRAKTKEFEADLGLVELRLKKLRESRNKPAIQADIDELERKVNTANAELNRLRSMRVTPKVTGDIDDLTKKLAVAQAELKKIDGETAQAKLDAVDAGFNRRVAAAEAKLQEFERKREAKLEADFNRAWAEANRINAKLDEVERKRVAKIDADYSKAWSDAIRINEKLDEVERRRQAKVDLATAKAQADADKMQAKLAKLDATTANPKVNLQTGSSNKRVQMIVSAVAMLAPAAAAATSSAGASILSLSTILMGGVATAGAAFAAFKGLGDAVKAAGTYGMEPTAANAKALDEALKGANRETQSFVRYLGSLAPQLKNLQNISRAGMFPGMEKGLRELMVSMPQVENVVRRASVALGELAAEGGDALNDPFWRNYFDFIASEAVPAFQDFMRSLGNIATGIAGLQMAVQPFTEDFVRGFSRMSREFAAWSQQLGTDKSFQEWLQYVREVGPQVMSTLGDIVEMFGAIGAALRPVAPIALDTISAIAGIIEAVAEIPGVGTAIFGLVAAFSALRLASMLLAASGLTRLVGAFGAAGAAARTGGGAMSAFTGAMMAGRGATSTHATNVGKAATATSRFATIAGGAARAVPILGTALMVGAVAYEAVKFSAEDSAEAMINGGVAASDAAAEMQRYDGYLQNLRDTFGNSVADLAEWGGAQTGLATSTRVHREELAKQLGTMAPLQRATAELSLAQTNLDLAIRDFGPSSQQAIDASRRLTEAQGNLKVQQELSGLAGKQYIDTLIGIAQQQGIAGDAARRMVSGLSLADVAASNATMKVDKFGNVVARLPDGKEVKINARAETAMSQLSVVSSQIDRIPPGKEVNVGVIGQTAIQMLERIGVQTRTLPDGTVVVKARDNEAKATLDAFQRYASTLEANPQMKVDPAFARNELIRFINEANAAVGLPRIDANTADGKAKIDAMMFMANNPPIKPLMPVGVNPGQFESDLAFMTQGIPGRPAPKHPVGANVQPGNFDLNAWTSGIPNRMPVKAPIGGNLQPARNDLGSFLGSVPGLPAPRAPVAGNTDPFANDVARAMGMVPVLPAPRAPVSANTQPAFGLVSSWEQYTAGLNPHSTFGAVDNASPISAQWFNAVNGMRPIANILANDSQAAATSRAWEAGTAALRPKPNIEANDAAAAAVSREWFRGTQGLRPKPLIDADNSNAMAAGRAVVNEFSGKTITMTIRANKVGFKDGGPVGGYAAGGPIQNAATGLAVRSTRTLGTGRLAGPGSGTSDSIPINAANGEWVVRRSVAAVQGAAKMTMLNAGLADIVPKGTDQPFRVAMPQGVQTGDHVRGDTVVHNYVEVHNPRAERSSDDIQRTMRKMANEGMFADG